MTTTQAPTFWQRPPLFDPGEPHLTSGVASAFASANARRSLGTLISRHRRGDWGDIDLQDARDKSYEHRDRLLSAYDLDGQHLWVITEIDRSATTILFPHEY